MRAKETSIYEMSPDELEAHMQKIVARLCAHDADPKNRQQVPGSIHLLTPAARKRSQKMAWAVYHVSVRQRELAGNPVNTAGYTGRNSNNR